jgi:hypothetical protein
MIKRSTVVVLDSLRHTSIPGLNNWYYTGIGSQRSVRLGTQRISDKVYVEHGILFCL